MAEPQLLAPSPRRLTDEELLRTEFRYSDPENITGLNRGVPDPEAHPTIIGYYDETPVGGRKGNPNAPMIRCCHCGLRRHWKGYVVRDDHGQLYIIGAQNCGSEHYKGNRFQDAEKAFRQEQERQRSLRRWRNMMKLVPAIRSEVTALLVSDGLRQIELKCGEIKRASPEGFAALIRHHGTGQPMVEVRETRDYAEEARREARYQAALTAYQKLPPEERRRRRDEGLRPEPDDTPIIVRSTEVLGPLTGSGFLTDSGDVRSAALDLRKTLDAIDAINASTTDAARVTDLNRILREMTDKPKRLWDALVEVSFAALFFEPANLERMERWSRAFPRFSYLALGDGLIVEDNARGRTRIEALQEVMMPTAQTIDGMRYHTDDFLPLMVEAA